MHGFRKYAPFCRAELSCISWGHAKYGELGYGPNAQKSSAIPKKVDIPEGMHVISVSCGMHSMVIVDRTNIGGRLDQVDIYDGNTSGEAIEQPVDKTPVSKQTPKKGTKAAENSKKRTKSKEPSESQKRNRIMKKVMVVRSKKMARRREGSVVGVKARHLKSPLLLMGKVLGGGVAILFQ